MGGKKKYIKNIRFFHGAFQLMQIRNVVKSRIEARLHSYYKKLIP